MMTTTPKELFILRHGLAGKPEPRRYPDDADRPLTKKGKTKTRKIAKGIRSLVVSVDLILTSPYRRAKETATIAARALGAGKRLHASKHLKPDGSYEELCAELAKQFSKCGKILIVGHEPFLSSFIAYLLGARPQLAIELKKGGFASMTVGRVPRFGNGVLHSLLAPRQLVQLA